MHRRCTERYVRRVEEGGGGRGGGGEERNRKTERAMALNPLPVGARGLLLRSCVSPLSFVLICLYSCLLAKAMTEGSRWFDHIHRREEERERGRERGGPHNDTSSGVSCCAIPSAEHTGRGQSTGRRFSRVHLPFRPPLHFSPSLSLSVEWRKHPLSHWGSAAAGRRRPHPYTTRKGYP